MTIPVRELCRGHAPSSFLPRGCLVVLLGYIVLIGGSEPGVFLVQFQILNAVFGTALVGWWAILLRRGGDRVDLLAMGALLTFLVACVFGAFPRQSFDAAMASLVWAASFGVARRYLTDDHARLLGFRVLAAVGLVLSVLFAAAWGRVWLDWLQLVGGFPPSDLTLPAHIYRHYYVVVMLLVALLPASVLMLRDLIQQVPAAIAIALTTILAVMSGSRTVWLAMAIAAVAAVVLVRPSRRVNGFVLALLASGVVLALATGGLSVLLERLLASGTVTYRLDIWAESLGIWMSHPLTGLGPGSFGLGITLTGLLNVYDFSNRHADNAAIQLVAEAGVMGIIAVCLLGAAIWTGRRPDLIGHRSAVLGLVIVMALSLTNNPTDSPNLVAILVAYAALVAPYVGPLETTNRRASWSTPYVIAGSGSALLVGAAVLAIAIGAVSHQAARSAAAVGDWAAASDALGIAVALDPALALYRREYGLVLEAEGRDAEALRQLDRATSLSPADAASWRALALQRARLGDVSGAAKAAEAAARLRPLDAENHLTIALVSPQSHDGGLSDALREAPWLSGSSAWTDLVDRTASLSQLLVRAAGEVEVPPGPRRAMQSAWLLTAVGRPLPIRSPIEMSGLSEVLGCDIRSATRSYEAMGTSWTDSKAGIVGRLMFERSAPRYPTGELMTIASLRQPALARAASVGLAPFAIGADPSEDARLYRRLSMGAATPGLVVPRDDDALSSWLVDPTGSARRGAPDIGLASCD